VTIKEIIKRKLDRIKKQFPLILPNAVYLGQVQYRLLNYQDDWPLSEEKKGHVCGLQIFLVSEENHLFIPPTYYKTPLP